MSAPGGILMAKIMMPDDPKDLGIEPVIMPEASHDEEKPANIIMAAAQGAQTGVKLAVAVGAMVLAFVALVALANGLLAGIGGWFGYPDLSFQAVIGAIFRSEEHTSELQSLMRISYAVFCLKKKKKHIRHHHT